MASAGRPSRMALWTFSMANFLKTVKLLKKRFSWLRTYWCNSSSTSSKELIGIWSVDSSMLPRMTSFNSLFISDHFLSNSPLDRLSTTAGRGSGPKSSANNFIVNVMEKDARRILKPWNSASPNSSQQPSEWIDVKNSTERVLFGSDRQNRNKMLQFCIGFSISYWYKLVLELMTHTKF